MEWEKSSFIAVKFFRLKYKKNQNHCLIACKFIQKKRKKHLTIDYMFEYCPTSNYENYENWKKLFKKILSI